MNDGHSTGIFLCRLERAKAIQSQHIFLYLLWKFSLFRFAVYENIHGLKFFGYDFKLSAFADDVSYFLKDINSVKELLKLLE